MRYLILVLALIATPAKADEIDFLKKAVTVLQTQRNQSNDIAAEMTAKLTIATEDLNKAQLKIKELENKLEEKDKR